MNWRSATHEIKAWVIDGEEFKKPGSKPIDPFGRPLDLKAVKWQEMSQTESCKEHDIRIFSGWITDPKQQPAMLIVMK